MAGDPSPWAQTEPPSQVPAPLPPWGARGEREALTPFFGGSLSFNYQMVSRPRPGRCDMKALGRVDSGGLPSGGGPAGGWGARLQEFPETPPSQAWLQARQQPAGLFVFWGTLKKLSFMLPAGSPEASEFVAPASRTPAQRLCPHRGPSRCSVGESPPSRNSQELQLTRRSHLHDLHTICIHLQRTS